MSESKPAEPDVEARKLLDSIFFPYNQRRTADALRQGGRFVYYTRAATALQILNSRKLWLRNAATMNDHSEISHGLACLSRAYRGPAGLKLKSALDGTFREISDEIEAQFNQLVPNIELDTFMACVSEHDAADDLRGRLSMWRAYGGNAGVAIVFNGAAMFGDSGEVGAFSSPVFYGNPADFEAEFATTVDGVAASVGRLATLGRDVVKNAVFQMLRFSAVSTKHPGFREEREWRITASPSLYHPERLVSAIEIIDGIPQAVMKIKLENDPDNHLVGMAPAELIDRIIIGPSQFPWAIHRAFHEVLSQLGVPGVETKVVVSDIPLRHNAL